MAHTPAAASKSMHAALGHTSGEGGSGPKNHDAPRPRFLRNVQAFNATFGRTGGITFAQEGHGLQSPPAGRPLSEDVQCAERVH